MLIYDGACGFCSRCAAWAARRLPPGTVTPWQALSDLGTVGLTSDEVAAAAWWIDADGRRHRGAQAVAGALRAIGGGWRLVGEVLTLPLVRELAAVAYRVVARNRHRLPGGTATCRLDANRQPGDGPQAGGS